MPVGNDYVWPRVTARAARGYARACGGRVLDEVFVPLGAGDFGRTLRRVERCEADAVLMLLVGAICSLCCSLEKDCHDSCKSGSGTGPVALAMPSVRSVD